MSKKDIDPIKVLNNLFNNTEYSPVEPAAKDGEAYKAVYSFEKRARKCSAMYCGEYPHGYWMNESNLEPVKPFLWKKP